MKVRYTSVAALASAIFLTGHVYGSKFSEFSHRKEKRAEDAMRKQEVRDSSTTNSTSSFRYLNDKTEPYRVTSLPSVPFDVGELYSGLVPVYDDPSRALFFMFGPTTGDPVDEVTIWLNGGPGCSSLEGFFQENGPFLWQAGTYQPVQNPYSWTNLTNMLWVEQPVTTGFSIGTANATSEEDIAADFVSWFKNWQDIFGIQNYKIYVTGESYAGRYVPYISAAMLDQNDTTYYDLSGALAYDPCIGSFNYVQQQAVAVPYAVSNNNLLNLNQSFVQEIESLHESCGYKEFVDTYLTYPPAGQQPPKFFNYSDPADIACDVFDMIDTAALTVNNCFDVYDINSQCPLLWDVLSFPTQLVYTPDGADTYFDRTDVKQAIHAPLNVTWGLCVGAPFIDTGGNYGPESEGDTSADPIQHVLPQVIEATNRVLISNGDYDMIIITDGTLLAIQNMTWNGQLGFQTQPSEPINITMPDLVWTDVFAENQIVGVDGPQGTMGIQHYERGLMWAESFQTGHMQPEFQPRVALRHIQWVLGRIDSL
ncbi:hypothetical protein N0V82_010310 [Gnomoniopsis sp. IMI 355080]|nr:hypothetical protein N0V82_010310 [Gnomoniopsis sp. IMI 355080]